MIVSYRFFFFPMEFADEGAEDEGDLPVASASPTSALTSSLVSSSSTFKREVIGQNQLKVNHTRLKVSQIKTRTTEGQLSAFTSESPREKDLSCLAAA